MDAFNGLRAHPRMAGYCLHVLEAKLKGWHHKAPPDEDVPEEVYAPGMFVTYLKGGQLRGCVGTFHEANLRENLAKYSLVSAMDDSRFGPIEPLELRELQCDVTLLSRPESIPDWQEWEVGTHGVSIFLDEGPGYSATFLPQVISDNGWSKYQTFSYLLRKSGYPNPMPSPDVFQKCHVQVYEADTESMHYLDYRDNYRDKWGFKLM